MNNIRNLFFICFIAILYSCNNKHHIEFSKDGTFVKIDYTGDTNKNQYTGDVKVYYLTGQLQVSYRVESGLKEGVLKIYYENGKIEYEENYKNDTLEGEKKYCNISGQVIYEREYRHNKLDGISAIYFDNGKLNEYDLWKDSLMIYELGFDTAGKIYKNYFRVYKTYPKTIRLGEKFRVEVTFPYLKGLNEITDFNLAIIPNNLSTTDSMKDYKPYSIMKNNKWIGGISNKELKRKYENIAVNNIPLDANGVGVYEFTPTSVGDYDIKAAATIIKNKTSKDSTFQNEHIEMKFKVIQ